MRLRGFLGAAVGLTASAVLAGPAFAAWSVTGSAAGTGTAATLQAPASATTSGVTASSITVQWTAPAGGPAPTGYRVERVSPAAVVCASTTALSCTDSGLSAATAYSYNVYALLHSWDGSAVTTSTSTTTSDTTAPTLTAVELVDSGGNPGLLREGDSVRFTFSEAMKPSSLCSSFSDSVTGSQTEDTNNDIAVSVSTADVLTVASTQCSGLALGSIVLPSAYTPSSTAALVYRGNESKASTLTYDPATNTLTVTLGKRDSLPATEGSTAVAAASITWSASGTIGRDSAGNAVSTTTLIQTSQRF